MDVRLEPLLDLADSTITAWQELVARVGAPNPFWEPAALLAAARDLPGGDRASLMHVVDDGRMQLAAPVVPGRRFRRVPVGHLATWTHDQCCLGNPFVEPEAATRAWAAVLDHLAERGTPWLVLSEIDVDGPATVALREALGARRRRVHALDAYDRPIVRKREGTAIELGLSSRHRSDLRRQRRGLERALGTEVVVEDLVETVGVDEAVTRFLDLEARGWKGRAGTALLNRDGDARFFRELCTRLHADGRLQLWQLGTASRAAALACNVLAGADVVRFKLCYDEDLGRHSPGVQLELAMLDAFEADPERRTVDSCAAADNLVYQRIYPDRCPTATLIVPTGGVRSRMLAATVPVAAQAFRRARGALRPRRR